MRSVQRPVTEPAELIALRNSGTEDFGPMAQPLHSVFSGACAYCERITTDDDDDLRTKFFTCDHFVPRHLLCHRDPTIGQCTDAPPPHSRDCEIYDWNNLMYACWSCAESKGGQWPRPGDSADGYIDPCCLDDSEKPHSVFRYDTENGRLIVRDDITGVVRNNAQRMIDDLALNHPRRGPKNHRTRYSAKARRIDLAELRAQRVRGLQRVLDALVDVDPEALGEAVKNYTKPGARFSSICAQFIRQSEYSVYL